SKDNQKNYIPLIVPFAT
nr:RecName: Full=Unknown placental glycoprotein 45J2 [Bison bonasus]